jgi:hypothetical protein
MSPNFRYYRANEPGRPWMLVGVKVTDRHDVARLRAGYRRLRKVEGLPPLRARVHVVDALVIGTRATIEHRRNPGVAA